MKPNKGTVTEFIDSLPNETRKQDGRFVVDMMQRITQHEPVRWGPSIIGFGDYVQVYDTGRKTRLPLMAFSPRKPHLVLYVLNNFKEQPELLAKLGKHKTGKICLYINKLTDVDLDVLERIVSCSYQKFKSKKEEVPA
jgi:hypothetical protein